MDETKVTALVQQIASGKTSLMAGKHTVTIAPTRKTDRPRMLADEVGSGTEPGWAPAAR